MRIPNADSRHSFFHMGHRQLGCCISITAAVLASALAIPARERACRACVGHVLAVPHFAALGGGVAAVERVRITAIVRPGSDGVRAGALVAARLVHCPLTRVFEEVPPVVCRRAGWLGGGRTLGLAACQRQGPHATFREGRGRPAIPQAPCQLGAVGRTPFPGVAHRRRAQATRRHGLTQRVRRVRRRAEVLRAVRVLGGDTAR
jgi:hypothetical protein